MKTYHVNSGAGIAGLAMREQDIPIPASRQVVVRVRATSLNFRELMILQGTYPLPVKPDVIPVSDGAGEVVSIGQGVTRAKPGDRVAATLFPQWIDGPFSFEVAAQIGGSLDGTLTEFALLSEDAVVQIPEHLSYEETATLPCAGVTAWKSGELGWRSGGRRTGD